MLRYVIGRLLFSCLVLFVISIMLFLMLRTSPGDPVEMYFDPLLFQGGDRDAAIARARAELGLDRPLAVQYVVWLRDTLQGNLGYSVSSGRPVAEVMGERLMNSAPLMLAALAFELILGVTAGVVAALRRNSTIDYSLSTLSVIGLSIPSFFLALVGVYFFGVKLGWFPTAGMNTPDGGLVTGLHHLVLPAVTLGITGSAAYVRWARSSMLDVLDRDFMVTARSKGLSRWRVVIRHGLHNALIPLITVVAMQASALFGGAVVIEQIFAWPGMGRFTVDSITTRDYPAIMGFVMFIAVLVVIMNLVADILYAVVDPRIRL